MKKTILTLTAMMAFCLGADAQYIMKITKADGDVITLNADDVASVTFEQSGDEQEGTTYTGWVNAGSAYFSCMVNNGDKITVSENGDGSVNVIYAGNTWGNGIFENVSVTQSAEGITLGETEGKLTMAGHGGVKEYDAILKSATISADQKTVTAEISVPSVMGGTTIEFQQGIAPLAKIFAKATKLGGWSDASSAYFQGMASANDTITITAVDDSSLTVELKSETWGEAKFENVPATVTAEGYALNGEVESTILMPGMGGGEPKSYAVTLKSGSIAATLDEFAVTFNAPAVLGGTTIEFQDGETPASEE